MTSQIITHINHFHFRGLTQILDISAKECPEDESLTSKIHVSFFATHTVIFFGPKSVPNLIKTFMKLVGVGITRASIQVGVVYVCRMSEPASDLLTIYSFVVDTFPEVHLQPFQE